ncbi:MAG: 2Fe-2S iron-sulfur cluster binding domain-containing protein [Oscillospiraceae bacterium]|nr:2Fe-2S iron-sulfur cluster binding domain-containing protein [Oscillospiraceae bacterium]
MSLNVKVGLIGLLDMLKFSNLSKTRQQAIDAAPAKDVKGEFKINEFAKAMHPDFQKFVVDEIIDHEGADAKSFILKRADGKPAAFFRAGEYVSLKLQIGDSFVTRPYSISSSPKWALEGKYAVTVKKNPGGFAADWMLENLKVGDEIIGSGGLGNFYYESVRDSKNVIALAGGSGITPFLSMAYAIRDGLEDFNLTILFGSRTEDAILFRKELDAVCAATDKVKVVHVLSDEVKEGFENGFLSADLIRKYAPEGDYSVFICGPEAMYRFVAGEVEKLGLDKKHVRRELLGVTKKVWDQPGYPADKKDQTFKITVKQGPNEYVCDASANESVLVALERAGIKAPSRCRSGECGWCRSKLVSGEVFIPEETDGRRWADKVADEIHPCASFPLSDLELIVPGEYY